MILSSSQVLLWAFDFVQLLKSFCFAFLWPILQGISVSSGRQSKTLQKNQDNFFQNKKYIFITARRTWWQAATLFYIGSNFSLVGLFLMCQVKTLYKCFFFGWIDKNVISVGKIMLKYVNLAKNAKICQIDQKCQNMLKNIL